jgi:glycosyltransferase involved in cell wall biosynthesis
MPPAVSVVVPAFNEAPNLPALIDEVILVYARNLALIARCSRGRETGPGAA